jgi:hypothetical protein
MLRKNMAQNHPDSLLRQVLDPTVVRQLRARLETVRVERANRMRQAQARVLQLEEDIARVALLSRAVTELFLKKGLFTKRELAEQLVATDIVDGALDFGLDPALALPGEERLREDEPRRRSKRAPAKRPAGKKKSR